MTILFEFIVTLKDIFVAWSSSICQFFVPPERKNVAGEIVLITGGGRGLGRRLAEEFARLRAVVVVWDVDIEGADETKELIRERGGVCHVYKCDVSDREQVKKQGQLVQQEVGHVTILINNAGTVKGRPLLDTSDEEVQRTLHVNLLAHFWTTKFFLPSMLKNNHGHITNIASTAGILGISKLTDYCASKFGVIGFTEVLNFELVFGGYTDVHTTLVCPSYIGDSAMFGGCQMRFPSVTPPLKMSETVERTMQAILTNQKQVYIPRIMYLVATLKTIVPVSVMTEILHFLGIDSFMNDDKDGTKEGESLATETGEHPSDDLPKYEKIGS
ncbi:epidermal retinol dehydrogenase 2-like [Littorina saxatilis]|uniref:Short-chain dehydrogenase/reductase 3 n=1 Tax=Littorina saxatilis TaxID=31220 RepID=A0AAN9AQF9_9CAEN